MVTKRFAFGLTCPYCGYKWSVETDMKYHVNCPDCRKMVPIREITKKLMGINEK